MAIKRSILRSRWFGDSLSFACTSCGKCCKGPSNAYLNESEVEVLSSHLRISKFDFVKKYTEEKETPNGLLTSLKTNVSFFNSNPSPDNIKPLEEHCVFLDGKKCSVYEVRPTSCRTYPFWPNTIMGKAEWTAESSRCEGINRLVSDGSESEVVSGKSVVQNLIIHEVYAKGLGPNWVYEDALDYLDVAEETNPSLITDFETEFFAAHHSNILYEDKIIRVVDATITIPGPDSSNSGTGPLEESSEDGDVLPNTEQATFRRLEFMNSLGLTQSEVRLRTIGSHTICDYSELALSAIYKLMAAIAKDALQQGHSNHALQVRRVAVIGAGGCVLPMHLLTEMSKTLKLSASSQYFEIDVVEPSAVVLDIARTFFAAKFFEGVLQSTHTVPGYDNWKSEIQLLPNLGNADQRVQHNIENTSTELQGHLIPVLHGGEDYFKTMKGDRQFEVVIIDAFEELSQGTIHSIAVILCDVILCDVMCDVMRDV